MSLPQINIPNKDNLYKNRSSQRNIKICKSEFDFFQNKNDEENVKSSISKEIKHSTLNCSKKRKIILISICFLSLLLIASIIIIIGHFKLGWFMKRNDLVIVKKREANLVSRYLEKKYACNYYDLEGMDENQKVQNNSVITDFIVGLNKKIKINKIFDFSGPDYLYEAFLLIINLTEINETESIYLGGLNIYDKSKSLQDLIKQNNEFFLNYSKIEQNSSLINKTDFNDNIPFSKFYFFENGTIDKIYFPQGINDFYKTEIMDLIKKVTPELSKSLYKNETNKRRLENGEEEGTFLNYEQIIKNGTINKTILYEDKKEKVENDDEYNFEKNQINSKIVRIFNSSGDMILLEMEGEASFKSGPSEKKNITINSKDKSVRLIEEIQEGEREREIKTNESYYKLGFNEFKMNVTSNMELIQNNIEPNILANLIELTKITNFEEYKDSNSTLTKNDGNETEINNSKDDLIQSNQTNEKRNLANNGINFSTSYQATYQLVSTSFLGLNIGLEQYLYINNKNGKRQGSINLILGSIVYTISTVEKYHYSYYKSGYITKNIIGKRYALEKSFKPFGFLISGSFNINFDVYHGVSFDIIDKEMYAKGYAAFEIGAEGSFGPNFIVISFGAKLKGNIANGEAYIQGNTLLEYGSNLALFYFYKKITACSVDLSFYFTINLLFWKKTYETTINLFKGFSSDDEFYLYG